MYIKTIAVAMAFIITFLAVVGCTTTTQTTTAAAYVNLDASEFMEKVDTEGVFTVDVHIPEQQHIRGTDAVIPFDEIESNINEFPADKSTPIALYCRSGSMSTSASQELIDLGYTTVYNLLGGVYAWEDAGFEFE